MDRSVTDPSTGVRVAMKQHRHDGESNSNETSYQGIAPGKVSTTSRMSPVVILRMADESSQRVQRDANGVEQGAEAAVTRASGSSGSPLPGDLRERFEGSLGADLSSVRIHTGSESASAAAAVGAKAYTTGNDIHFAADRFDPSSAFGVHLIAHEVAHTQQQAGGPAVRQHKLEVSTPGDHAEVEADRAADAMVSGATAPVSGGGGGAVHRDVDTTSERDDAAGPESEAAEPEAMAEATGGDAKGEAVDQGAQAEMQPLVEAAAKARQHQDGALDQVQRLLSAEKGNAAKSPAESAPADHARAGEQVSAEIPSPPESAPVQMRATGAPDRDDVQQLAQGALATPTSSLPFADIVQASFGRHDVSHVQAHVGEKASAASRQMGALAFASGGDVVFGDTPDLFTSAHEAAHVVQQRAGARPAGGVGAQGDEFERHADEVAHVVTRGDSAESLLDQYAGSGGGGVAVQMKGASIVPELPELGTFDVPAMPSDSVLKKGEGRITYDQQEFVRRAGPLTGAHRDISACRTARDSLQATVDDTAAINAAIAQDRASGAQLETPLGGEISSYQTCANQAKGVAQSMVGIPMEIEGMLGQIHGKIAETKANNEKEGLAEDKEAERQAAQARVDAAKASAEATAGAASTIFKIAVTAISEGEKALVKGVVGTITDQVLSGLQSLVSFGITKNAAADMAAAEQRINAKFAKIKADLNAESAAGVKEQLDGLQAVIAGKQVGLQSAGTQWAALVQGAAKHLQTILKAPSKDSGKVSAMPLIQEYIESIATKAGALRACLDKAEPQFQWPYVEMGETLKLALAGLTRVQGGVPASDGWGAGASESDYAPEEKQVSDNALALRGWVDSTVNMIDLMKNEIQLERRYISGPHMAKAEAALEQVRSLGDKASVSVK